MDSAYLRKKAIIVMYEIFLKVRLCGKILSKMFFIINFDTERGRTTLSFPSPNIHNNNYSLIYCI